MMSRACGRSAVVAVGLVGLLGGGCAFGTTHLGVYHRALDPVATTRQGNILVRKFADKRPAEEQPYIGNKRNGFGMVLGHVGVEGGTPVPDLLTKFYAEAVAHAGYTVTVEGSQPAASGAKYDAIVDGEVTRFWEDLYMMVWQTTDVTLKLRKTPDGEVVWTGRTQTGAKYLLWLGFPAELARPVAVGLTKALNSAAAQCASDEFYQHVKK